MLKGWYENEGYQKDFTGFRSEGGGGGGGGRFTFEQSRDRTNDFGFLPSFDLDQPEHPVSLISLCFALKQLVWALTFFMCKMIIFGRCPGLPVFASLSDETLNRGPVSV